MKKTLALILVLLFTVSCAPAWATNASKTPAPGTVPISRSDSSLDPGWYAATGKTQSGVYYCKTEADLITAIADGTKPLIQITGSFALTANRTVPVGQTLWMPDSAFLITTTGWTLTINGYFPRPGPIQVFTGTGTVVFGSGALDYTADPAWFGANVTYANTAAANVIATLTANSATPSVIALAGMNGTYKTNNSTATTITNFTNGVLGQKFTLIANDAYTSIQFGTNILGYGGSTSSILLSSGDSSAFTYDGTYWHCANLPQPSYSVYKNRLINGEMRIDQRHSGASQTVATTDTGDTIYRVDRWAVGAYSANIAATQSGGAGQWKNYLQLTGSTSNTGFIIFQRIESNNIYDLASQTVTLSVYAASTSITTLTWAVFYANSTDNWGASTQISTGTWSITSGLTRYSAQINLPSSAVNGVGIVITGGALVAGQTFSLTGCQLEPGSILTNFERRPDDVELLRCKRYCPCFVSTNGSSMAIGYSQASAANTMITTTQLQIPPRVQPTGIVYTGSMVFYQNTDASYGTGGASNAIDATWSSPAAQTIRWINTGGAGITAGATVYTAAISGGSSTPFYFTGCEL